MEPIFSSAEEVILWLGEADQTSDLAMNLFRNLFLEDLKDDAVCNVPNTGPPPPLEHLSESLVGAIEHESSYEAMLSLMSREYWSRTWIIQEIVLAKRVVVHCGQRSIPWEAFETYERCMQQISGWVDQATRGEGPLVSMQEAHQNLAVGRRVSRCKSLYRTISMSIIEHRRDRSTIANDLPGLLGRYQYSNATRLHDKVYGMFGIWDSPYKSLLVVDYEDDILELSVKVVRVCGNSAEHIDDFSALLQESLRLVTPHVGTLIQDRHPMTKVTFAAMEDCIRWLAEKRWGLVYAMVYMEDLREEILEIVKMPIVAVFDLEAVHRGDQSIFVQRTTTFKLWPDVLEALHYLDFERLRNSPTLCIFDPSSKPSQGCKGLSNAGWTRVRPTTEDMRANGIPANIVLGHHRMKFMLCVMGTEIDAWFVSADAEFNDVSFPYVMQLGVRLLCRQWFDRLMMIGKAIFLGPFVRHPTMDRGGEEARCWSMISQQEFDEPTHLDWRKQVPAVNPLEPHRLDSRLPSLDTDYSLSLVSSRGTELATRMEESGDEASRCMPMFGAVTGKTLEVEDEEKELELALV